MMPTGFGNSFFLAVLHSDRTEKKTREGKVSEQCDCSYFCPVIGLIEDQIKEAQPLGLICQCASLQDVNDLFSYNPWPQLQQRRILIMTARSSKTDLPRFLDKLN